MSERCKGNSGDKHWVDEVLNSMGDTRHEKSFCQKYYFLILTNFSKPYTKISQGVPMWLHKPHKPLFCYKMLFILF